MVQLDLSSEDKLLLYCARLSLSEDIRQKIKEILNKTLNWNYIVECSAKQGISPLFYWNLKKVSDGKDVPFEVMKKLEKTYYGNLARNMLLYDELAKILKAFKKEGIETIVMKGAFLAEEIYRNIGLRPMSDIDLLIKLKDLKKARTELTKLKYSASIFYQTELHEQLQMVWFNELPPFFHETKEIIVEIHWDIQPPNSPHRVDINEFWNKAKPAEIAGVEMLTFAPEDLMLHLCLHVNKHNTLNIAPPAQPLRDYCDIAEVTRHYKDRINWNYLLQKSKDYGAEEPIFQGLSIVKEYFGANVPENVISELKPVKFDTNFEDIFKGITKEDQSNTFDYLFYLRQIKGNRNKVLIIFGDIFPSKEYMMYRYSIKNEKQVYIYYLIRMGSVFKCGLAMSRQLPHYLLKFAFGKKF